MRGYLFIDQNKKNKFIDECFDAYWKNNIDISIKENVNKILINCKLEKDLFNKGINDQKIKDELKELTDKAFKLDVFGAPTFSINGKIFWGQDRLDYALEEYNS